MIYKIYDLKLECSEYLIFLLGWVMMYVIDEISLLYGVIVELFVVGDVLLLFIIEGVDEIVV